MQDPLKQGLKRQFNPGALYWRRIRMQDPLKQGLKLLSFDSFVEHVLIIRMQDPLKQGLKHVYTIISFLRN